MSRFHEHVKNRPFIDPESRRGFADFTLDLIESQLRYDSEKVSSLALGTYFTVPKQNNLYESGEIDFILTNIKSILSECEDLKEKIDVMNDRYIKHSIKESIDDTVNDLFSEIKNLKSKTTEKELQVFFAGLLNLLSATYITRDPAKKMMYLHYVKVLMNLAYNFSKRDGSQRKDDDIVLESTTSNNMSYFAGKKDVKSIKPISNILRYIDTNSREKIDLQRIRKKLEDDSKYYGLREIDAKKLIIQDENKLTIPDEMDITRENPIVVSADGWVIDGRHRAKGAKEHNMKVGAGTPMQMK